MNTQAKRQTSHTAGLWLFLLNPISVVCSDLPLPLLVCVLSLSLSLFLSLSLSLIPFLSSIFCCISGAILSTGIVGVGGQENYTSSEDAEDDIALALLLKLEGELKGLEGAVLLVAAR